MLHVYINGIKDFMRVVHDLQKYPLCLTFLLTTVLKRKERISLTAANCALNDGK